MASNKAIPTPREGNPEEIDEKSFFRKLRRIAGKVPFSRDLLSLYFVMLDSRTPVWVKSLAAGAIAYFLMPFDVIPDFIVGLGYTDDAAVIAGTLYQVHDHVEERHRAQADEFFDT